MVSGTSMAAPHIAGIAALIKQKNPKWSPSAIKSALMTTANTLDKGSHPLRAQQYSASEMMTLSQATPFDCGSGAVNPKAALDPGLVLDASKLYLLVFFQLCLIVFSSFYHIRCLKILRRQFHMTNLLYKCWQPMKTTSHFCARSRMSVTVK
jgi:hypothetical protein